MVGADAKTPKNPSFKLSHVACACELICSTKTSFGAVKEQLQPAYPACVTFKAIQV